MRHRTWIIGVAAAFLVLAATALFYPMVSGPGLSLSEWVEDVRAEEQARQELPQDQAPGVRRDLQRHFVRGTVLEVGTGEILVEAANGETATVLLTGTTRLWVPGEALTETIDLVAGDPVLVLGRPVVEDTDGGALEGRLVVVVSDEDLPRVLILGHVVTTTRHTIVVQARRGERAITVLPRTHILSPSGKLDSLQDVQSGDLIVSLGQPTRIGQWVAGFVFVSGPRPRSPVGQRGEVDNPDLEPGTLEPLLLQFLQRPILSHFQEHTVDLF